MTEIQMMITTRELLQTSIGQLQILAAFLGEQLGGCDDRSKSETAETWACHAILDQLTALILKLESAGGDQPHSLSQPAVTIPRSLDHGVNSTFTCNSNQGSGHLLYSLPQRSSPAKGVPRIKTIS
jgi:hypothetical protein